MLLDRDTLTFKELNNMTDTDLEDLHTRIEANIQNPCSETLEIALLKFCLLTEECFAWYPQLRESIIQLLHRTYFDVRMKESCKSVARNLAEKIYNCYNCEAFRFHSDDSEHLTMLCEI